MRYDTEQMIRLSNVLGLIKKSDTKCTGICHSFISEYRNAGNLMANMAWDLNTLKQAMIKWPKYSGDPTFPVPSGDPWYKRVFGSGRSASQAYNISSMDKAMWNPETRYGALRLELLDWLIDEFGESDNV